MVHSILQIDSPISASSSLLDIAVGFSNYQAGYAMARHLIDSGRRDIAFIGGNSLRDERRRRRREGCTANLSDASLAPIMWPGDKQDVPSGIEVGAEFFKGCLPANPQFDAAMCVSDQVAMGVLCEACIQEHRITEYCPT